MGRPPFFCRRGAGGGNLVLEKRSVSIINRDRMADIYFLFIIFSLWTRGRGNHSRSLRARPAVRSIHLPDARTVTPALMKWHVTLSAFELGIREAYLLRRCIATSIFVLQANMKVKPLYISYHWYIRASKSGSSLNHRRNKYYLFLYK